jgi:hypothetical protein
MERTLYLVQTEPVLGREVEFNDWYTNVHLPEVVAIPGIVAAQRFKVHSVQRVPDNPEPSFRYIALYEFEGDPGAAFEALNKAIANGMQLSESVGRSASHLFQPVSERVMAGSDSTN